MLQAPKCTCAVYAYFLTHRTYNSLAEFGRGHGFTLVRIEHDLRSFNLLGVYVHSTFSRI